MFLWSWQHEKYTYFDKCYWGLQSPIRYNIYDTIRYDTIRYDTIRYDTIRYDTIRYDTIRYDTIRYDTIRYDTIRYDTIRYDTIRYDTIRYDTIFTVRCGAVRCGAVRCGAVRCGAVRYGTVRYGTVRYGTVRYGTVRYGTVRYDTIRYLFLQYMYVWGLVFSATVDTFVIVVTMQYCYNLNKHLNVAGVLKHVNNKEHENILCFTTFKVVKYMIFLNSANVCSRHQCQLLVEEFRATGDTFVVTGNNTDTVIPGIILL